MRKVNKQEGVLKLRSKSVTGEKASLHGFSEIIKKAYEKGHNEQEITVLKLIEDLKIDLKNMMVN